MKDVIPGLIMLFFVLAIPMQIFFAIKIKIMVKKLRKKNQITQEDAETFHKGVRTILWVPYTDKYFSLLREGYNYICESPLVEYQTKKKVHSSLRFRLVHGITLPKQYDKK